MLNQIALEDTMKNVQLYKQLADIYSYRAKQQSNETSKNNMIRYSKMHRREANIAAKQLDQMEKKHAVGKAQKYSSDMENISSDNKYSGCCGWLNYKLNKIYLRLRFNAKFEANRKMYKITDIHARQGASDSLATERMLNLTHENIWSDSDSEEET